MILFVNGDSHTAGAEAVNPHAFAEDDRQYFYMGRAPHPDNLQVSWGKLLSETLRSGFHCAAESASSNDRILRTTRDWLAERKPTTSDLLVVIQWSTWEREEWLHNNVYYQVGASGIDHVPPELADRYRAYVINTDWNTKTQQAHADIWQFHQELVAQDIKHVFFNGNTDFSKITNQQDWGCNYMDPYSAVGTYNSVLRSQGIDTVLPNSWHFGPDGHAAWHRHMLNYIIKNQFV